MEEINLQELFKFFISKYKILIGSVLMLLGFGILYISFLLTPLYHSSTTLILVSDNNNSQNSTMLQSEINVNKNLVSTYSEIVKSRLVLGKVIKELNLDMTVEKLSSLINVSSVEDTEIIKIEVTSKDNAKARDIAATTSSVFMREIQKIYNLTNVSIVDRASIENVPYNVRPVKQLALFSIGGFALGAAIIFLIFYFDTTIKSSKDIEEKLGLSVIGNITLVDSKDLRG